MAGLDLASHAVPPCKPIQPSKHRAFARRSQNPSCTRTPNYVLYMFMSSTPLPASIVEATSHQQDVMNDLMDLGHRLVRLAVVQAEANTITIAEATKAYDRTTRNIRKCVLLFRKLAEPWPAVNRTAIRKRILREVEDSIQRHAEEPEAETLHGELLDRLDTLDLEDDIGGRPVEDIILDIIRDLGLAAYPGSHPWKRRTPSDLAELLARAAQPVSAPASPGNARRSPEQICAAKVEIRR